MQVRLSSQKRDIIDHGTVFLFNENADFTAKNITYSNGTYAGGATVKPTVTVKDAKTETVLTEGKDYKIIVDPNGYGFDAVNAGITKIPFAIQGLGKYKYNYVN